MPADPNIKEVYALVNGVKVVAAWDEESSGYVVETSAPSESSWSQPGHVYLVSLHAIDLAGNTAEMTSEDGTYGDQLKIRVLEKTAPTADITYPTESSVIGKNSIEVKMSIHDAGGSGLNMDKVELKVNGVKVDEGIQWTGDTDSEKTGTYTASNLSDGANSITLKVTDNDGNESAEDTVNFIISTKAPSLDITEPKDSIVTNSETITVSGTATAGDSYVTITQVTINGAAATVDPDAGTFSETFTLEEGDNTITIVATDSAGHTTQVERHVRLDTHAPVISEVKAVATTVDANGTIRITFKVTEA